MITFDIKLEGNDRPRWSGNNLDVHCFGNLVVKLSRGTYGAIFVDYLPCLDEDAHAGSEEDHPARVLVVVD